MLHQTIQKSCLSGWEWQMLQGRYCIWHYAHGQHIMLRFVFKFDVVLMDMLFVFSSFDAITPFPKVPICWYCLVAYLTFALFYMLLTLDSIFRFAIKMYFIVMMCSWAEYAAVVRVCLVVLIDHLLYVISFVWMLAVGKRIKKKVKDKKEGCWVWSTWFIVSCVVR